MVAEVDTGAQVERHIQDGRARMQSGRWSEAIENFNEALKIDPENAEAKKPFFVSYWPNFLNFLQPEIPKRSVAGLKVAGAFPKLDGFIGQLMELNGDMKMRSLGLPTTVMQLRKIHQDISAASDHLCRAVHHCHHVLLSSPVWEGSEEEAHAHAQGRRKDGLMLLLLLLLPLLLPVPAADDEEEDEDDFRELYGACRCNLP